DAAAPYQERPTHTEWLSHPSRSPRAELAEQVAAVHHQQAASHVARRLACQEERCCGDVVRLARAPEWDACQERTQQIYFLWLARGWLWRGGCGCSARGRDASRSDGVDGDAILAPLLGQRFGLHQHTTL